MPDKKGSHKKASTSKRSYKKQIGPSRENKWISHVKAYSAQNNVPYNVAIKLAGQTYK